MGIMGIAPGGDYATPVRCGYQAPATCGLLRAGRGAYRLDGLHHRPAVFSEEVFWSLRRCMANLCRIPLDDLDAALRCIHIGLSRRRDLRRHGRKVLAFSNRFDRVLIAAEESGMAGDKVALRRRPLLSATWMAGAQFGICGGMPGAAGGLSSLVVEVDGANLSGRR